MKSFQIKLYFNNCALLFMLTLSFINYINDNYFYPNRVLSQKKKKKQF